ncbi:Glycosyl phosphatidyl inositol protein transamidase complex subunit [Tulasnella sp. 417]|nr:Glycosyl phosphatidyl inositol protein transamidase complex subunit [Tulasnella sp. 417]
MVLIPFQDLSRGTWVDENALQPAQVTTYWSWDDVHAADNYLAQIEDLYARNATNIEKAGYIEEQFISLGLNTGVQPYKLTSSVGSTLGANAYGVYPVPRASGAEAIVISASWVSRTDEGAGTPNMRGVATVLALARYLKKYSLWAKDLIFVVNDGHVDGMHAWLNAYHGIEQPNLQTKPLKHVSGVIWTALCIDYPGHSFSHLGIFYEGLNGRLPNQDLMNSVVRIAGTTGVPTILYDNIESSASYTVPNWLANLPLLGKWTKHWMFKNYLFRASNVKRHVQYEGLNRGSGVHGLFHKFRIDAITLFGVPSMGPHGFHSLGQVIESSLRTMNNLLERLHASFFFYILTSVTTFVNFGGYLASAILVSVSMIFGGLRLWVIAGWQRTMVVRVIPDENDTKEEVPKKEWPTAIPMTVWRRRDRPVIQVLAIMLVTHVIGYLVFLLVTAPFFFRKTPALSGLFTRLAMLPFLALHPFTRQYLTACPSHSYYPKKSAPQAPLHLILKAFNLYISSIVISITSVLNFSLAAGLAVLLGLPLTFTGTTAQPLRYLLVLAVSPMGILSVASHVFGEQEVVRVLTRTCICPLPSKDCSSV